MKKNLFALAVIAALATSPAQAAAAADENTTGGLSMSTMLWGAGAVGMFAAGIPALGTAAAIVAYSGYKGNPSDQFSQVQLADLNGQQRQAMKQIIFTHAKDICTAQGMQPSYWESVGKDQLNAELKSASDRVTVSQHQGFSELAANGGHFMSDAELKATHRVPTDSLYVHSAARVTLAGTAWMGVTCIQTKTWNDTNLTVNQAPMEIWATKDGVTYRTLDVIQNLSWNQAIAAAGSAEAAHEKASF